MKTEEAAGLVTASGGLECLFSNIIKIFENLSTWQTSLFYFHLY